MEPGKGLGKAFRRIIPIFIGGINDLLPCGKQVLSGQRQPAVPNIFVGCHTRHEAEGPVEIIARHVNLPGNILIINFFQHVRFHIIDRLL